MNTEASSPFDLDAVVRTIRKVLGPIASLKITVTLFALSMILVFFGTLAQVGQGLWTVVDKYFYSWWVEIELKYFWNFGKLFFFFPPSSTSTDTVPFPAGKTIGWAMFVNLMAAHTLQLVNLIQGVRKQIGRTHSITVEVLRVMLKRSGIYILHGGVLLLLVGEWVTREYAVEQQMRIEEGGSADFSLDTRNFELALVESQSSATEDHVIAIPASRLSVAATSNSILSDPALPVRIQVRQYFKNAKLIDAVAGQANTATAGYGLRHIAKPIEEVSGLDTSKDRDVPAAYIEFFNPDDGKSFGVYLVTPLLKDQPIALDKPYVMSLRSRHYYKPYRIELIDFTFERYMGTQKAKNFSSRVRLIDPAWGEDREVTISMNNPLRHRGETYYQADFDKDTEKATILQVVKNPGWLIPYISCIMASVGMCVHFGIMLVTFLARLPVRVRTAPTSAALPTRSLGSRMLPVLIGGGATMLVLMAFSYPRKPKGSTLDLSALARLPVVEGGRVKPLDTVARVDLRQMTHAEELEVSKGVKISALKWFMDVASADKQQLDGPGSYDVFRIHNDQVYRALGLTGREGYRYSFKEIEPALGKLAKLAAAARKVDEKKQDAAQKQAILLSDHVQTYLAINFSAQPLLLPPLDDSTDWRSYNSARNRMQGQKAFADTLRDRALAAGLRNEMIAHEFASDLSDEERLLLKLKAAPELLTPELAKQLQPRFTPSVLQAFDAKLQSLTGQQMDLVTMILNGNLGTPEFQKLSTIIDEESTKMLMKQDAAAAGWNRILVAYRAGEPEAFNESVEAFRSIVEPELSPAQQSMCKFEEWMNRTALYYACTVLYCVAGVVALVGFLCMVFAPNAGSTIRRSVFWLMLFTFAIHTFTLLGRMYLMERPLVFVTNLYSSAVFIGWGVVGLCLLLEALAYPIGISSFAASIMGFSTSLIAHNLALEKDTLEMMQAVLDTNGWLASHVTTVTLGYSATYLAGLLGLFYVMLYMVQNDVLKKKVQISSDAGGRTMELGQVLNQLLYAVIAFATLLSFVGTVLGGIWADQSWGRFWGWDPKENGAVLIVIWNALILHARWAGLVKERGMAVLAIAGNMITTWSWFGTNQLGEGLHAYGFNSNLALGCTVVWAFHAFWIAAGILPWRWIWSGTTSVAAAVPPPPPPPPRAKRVK